ncbi:5496_t:CDS:2, partial [Scutellospora calospora]
SDSPVSAIEDSEDVNRLSSTNVVYENVYPVVGTYKIETSANSNNLVYLKDSRKPLECPSGLRLIPKGIGTTRR